MSIFTRLWSGIKEVIHRLIPYKDVEQAEQIETTLSPEMANALDLWYDMYRNKSPWLKPDTVKSLNLPAFICGEMARQITIEMKWNITAKQEDGTQSEDGVPLENPRSKYLKAEFERCIDVIRPKLEQALASGGIAIKPYTKNGHIYFDFTADWSLYPISFDDEGKIADVIFRDVFVDGKTYYTRLERHAQKENGTIHVTHRAFKSSMRDSIGTEIPLSDVPQWSDLEPELDIKDTGGQMFGWFKVANANNIDTETPYGMAIFAKAVDVIKEADMQYSRLMWEYEGGELAIDVDPSVLRPKKDGSGSELPRLNERLFRGVDMGKDDNYSVFAPPFRDTSLTMGLNQLLIRIEDLCGFSRGAISDANVQARTATELRILRQRSYATIADNQKALERCLRDVVRVMDKYATIYKLAPEGEYEVSFEWDDSIITDASQQMAERMTLLNAGIMSKAEVREWYFGETKAQAQEAVNAVTAEQQTAMMGLMPQMQAENDMSEV